MSTSRPEPVQRQRGVLCDLLDSLTEEQWNAETMCDGWDAGDMVAHLNVREREPWASVGLIVKPLAGLHESRMANRKKAGRDQLMNDLRNGPPWLWTKGVLARVQVGEDYIHTEDVRRGGAVDAAVPSAAADLTPDDGTGDPERQKILWEAVSRFALQTLGGIEASGVIQLTDGTKSRSFQIGGRMARSFKDTPLPSDALTITGQVGDLLLFTTGRTAADVAVTGPETLQTALRKRRRQV